MNKAYFETAININYWQQEVGQQQFINTWSVKGPIFVMRNGAPVAVWTDKKTSGYPLEVMVNTLVLTGGNWQGESQPIEVYERERKEELKIGDDVLELRVTPFADYFIGLPETTIRQQGRKGYCGMSTIFVGEVDEERLYNAMKISNGNMQELIRVLNLNSNESQQVLTTVADLQAGIAPYVFGFGDGKKVYDILKERYNIETKPKDLHGAEVIRLSSSPLDAFETRREVLEAYLRRGNNPFFGAVTDQNVFGN